MPSQLLQTLNKQMCHVQSSWTPFSSDSTTQLPCNHEKMEEAAFQSIKPAVQVTNFDRSPRSPEQKVEIAFVRSDDLQRASATSNPS